MTKLKLTSKHLNPMFKMYRASLLTVGLLLCCEAHGQDLKVYVNKKGKVGFVDKTGAEVIKCKYESARPFENGYAIVTNGGKSGIINTAGKTVLSITYESITPYTNDLYLIKKGKTQGLASKDGKIVLKPKYTFISRPNCYGKALLAKGGKKKSVMGQPYILGGKYGIINNHGKILIEPKYKGLYEFSYAGNKEAVYTEGYRLEYTYHYLSDTLVTDCSYLGFSNIPIAVTRCGIMDGNGQQILKQGLYDIVMKPQNDMVRYYNQKKKNLICGYHNLKTGKGFVAATLYTNISKVTKWTHGDFTGLVAPVNGDSWSFMDKDGKVLRSGYSTIAHSKSTALWAAQESSGKYTVFDDNNNTVSALSGYDEIYMPTIVGDQEVFIVKKGNVAGGINRNGTIVIPFEYESAKANNYNFIPVKKDGKWGAVSASGQEIIPTVYADVIYPAERGAQHLWVAKDDKLFYHFNVATKQTAPQGYEGATNFKNSLAHVRPVGMKLDNTTVNRAQIFVPNTYSVNIDTVKVEQYRKYFGYLLTSNDEYLIDQPISTVYIKPVVKYMEKQNFRPLTEAEKKNLLLAITRENRSYGLKSTLTEDEWNY